ncbi:MAG: hypothetical protein BM563_02275 [Bacteroidetes bacterium MedPE-SWsnd-G1]|nr:MAG: hypothetical protein BM563_02275 [Bacteroidetes bacterium MedPE-SWsnd-G1]
MFIIETQIQEIILYKFPFNKSISNWRIVDDGVMGGRSQGGISMSPDNTVIYSGNISLDNNGGFSSLRLRISELNISKVNAVKLRIKADSKNYQFRIKKSHFDRHSYVNEFSTGNEWQEIIIPFKELKPQFRGRKLNMPVFNGSSIGEIAFLIGNKVEESFLLEIDSISLIKIEE